MLPSGAFWDTLRALPVPAKVTRPLGLISSERSSPAAGPLPLQLPLAAAQVLHGCSGGAGRPEWASPGLASPQTLPAGRSTTLRPRAPAGCCWSLEQHLQGAHPLRQCACSLPAAGADCGRYGRRSSQDSRRASGASQNPVPGAAMVQPIACGGGWYVVRHSLLGSAAWKPSARLPTLLMLQLVCSPTSGHCSPAAAMLLESLDCLLMRHPPPTLLPADRQAAGHIPWTHAAQHLQHRGPARPVPRQRRLRAEDRALCGGALLVL